MDYALIIAIISATLAGIGLFLTGIGLLLNWQSIKENNRTREIQLLTNVFNTILTIESKLYTEYKGKDKKEWDSLLFNSIEYFAFLINNKFISNEKIASFFNDAIIRWYEEIFLKHYKDEEIKDRTLFPELKRLYHRLKAKSYST